MVVGIEAVKLLERCARTRERPAAKGGFERTRPTSASACC
jgi:hypothetical protein